MYRMNNEVHIFGVEATARQQQRALLDGNEHVLPARERCSIILFMRQKKGTDSDWDLAKKTLSKAGWGNIEIIQSGRITLEKLNEAEDDPVSTCCYTEALTGGKAFLVYQDIED